MGNAKTKGDNLLCALLSSVQCKHPVHSFMIPVDDQISKSFFFARSHLTV